jgi:hypothetical protein
MGFSVTSESSLACFAVSLGAGVKGSLEETTRSPPAFVSTNPNTEISHFSRASYQIVVNSA